MQQGNLFTRGRQLTLLNDLELPPSINGVSAKVIRAVLRCLDDHARDGADCCPSLDRIRECTDISRPQIFRALVALEQLNLIIRERRSCFTGRAPSRVRIVWSNMVTETPATIGGKSQPETGKSQGETGKSQGETVLNRLLKRPINRQGGVGGISASEGGAEKPNPIALKALQSVESVDRMFRNLAADPEIDLDPTPADRVLWHACILALAREVRQVRDTPERIRDPPAMLWWRLRSGRARWTAGITAGDRRAAERSIECLDGKGVKCVSRTS
jgi:hypothetical protein